MNPMNRLQKKCVIGTVGIHLLLLTILIVGPAFFNREPKLDNSQILTFIPANLVDAPNSGVQNAQPPAPAPATPPQPPQPLQQIPLPPKIVTPPPPTPTPSLLDRVENYFTPAKPAPTVTPDLTHTQRHTETQQQQSIKVNLTKVHRTSEKQSAQQPDNSRAINNAVRSLSHEMSSATTVSVPGTSGANAANYKDALATIYYNAWTTPDNAASDLANTKARITVATDGTVITAQIITPSGDAQADASVQRALDAVASVPPLPDQSKTQEEFIIDFNLKTKRMLE